MIQLSVEDAVTGVLTSIRTERLAVLCGAGLSMARPSSLPSAAALARTAKQRYEAYFGGIIPADLGEQADFFFERGELATVFLRSLVDPHAFAGTPNVGHSAIADLLLAGAIQTGISTNVDTLIEHAAGGLFGEIAVGVDRSSIVKHAPSISPLLKLHGCWRIDRDNTVWGLRQLGADPVATRIAENAEWLETRLLDRDLVIVGYFTDWDYLNELLEKTLSAVHPSRVLLIDPSEPDSLTAKAPKLCAICERLSVEFAHIRSSGDAFFDTVRREFSRAFLRQILHVGADAFEATTGNTAPAAWREQPVVTTEMAWQLRRDFEGAYPGIPATMRLPPTEPLLGLTVIQLLQAGAVFQDGYWHVRGRAVRIVRGANQMLQEIQSRFVGDTAPVVAPDMTIAVGAQDVALPSTIARASARATIARGTAGLWASRELGLEILGICPT